MKYTKGEIESMLHSMLYDLLSSYNQEGAIKSFKYNEERETCTIELSTHIVEEDDYIGFDGY